MRSAPPQLLALCLLVAGCGHHPAETYDVPAPPEIEQPIPPTVRFTAPKPAPTPDAPERVLSTEIGTASWYGAPYHNARSANGHVYDANAMTAAHRTLPLGSIVRVTNLATQKSAVVTITDRGPFVPGRMLDMSRAAAIQTGVWRTGTARVRLEVLSSPPAAARGGKWCVQIGSIARERSAEKLRDQLESEYPDASVTEFRGASGYWVRIGPAGRSRGAALEIMRVLRLSEGVAYVVRLD